MFPRPEKPFEFKVVKDVTGMTEVQKRALLAVWMQHIKIDLLLHSRSIFLLFFEQNPSYLKRFDFRHATDVKLSDNNGLQAHAMNVLNVVSAIIEYGIFDPPLFEFIMNKLMQNHQRRGIRRSDIRNMLSSFKTYLMTLTEKEKVDNFEEAVDALFLRITQSFEN